MSHLPRGQPLTCPLLIRRNDKAIHRCSCQLVFSYISCSCCDRHTYLFFFFLNDPAPPEIYPLPLHAALPIPPHFGCPPPARPSTPPGPFTQALRQPGVPRGAAFDEFGAAGLGRHRHTEDWLAHRA